MSERESKGSLADWAQVISAGVGIVAAVVAGVIGWLSIQQGDRQSEQARTTRTLEFFATYNSQSNLETRRLLDNEDWCSRYEYLNEEGYQAKVSDTQIISLIDFFDAVHRSCPPEGEDDALAAAHRGTCDRQFAEELLVPYAEDIYPELSRFILNGRANGRGDRFGQGIASLAKSHDGETIEQVADAVERHCRGLQSTTEAPASTDSR